MGRAGGGGGSRSFGGGFGGSRGGGSRSFGGSRSSGSRSFSSGGRGSSGGFSGGIGGAGGFGGGSYHHRPSGYGRGFMNGMMLGSMRNRTGRTVIINNSGANGGNSGNTNTGGNQTTYSNPNNTSTNQSYTNPTYTETLKPKPPTMEEKIAVAERRAERAKEEKAGAGRWFLIAAIFLLFGVFAVANKKEVEEFQKYNLSGTQYAGYATDEINGTSGTRKTIKACEEFYETVGIPLYFYVEGDYAGVAYEEYAAELYDDLFSDENHALFVYYDDADTWSWCTGSAANAVMNDAAVNELFDAIGVYWNDYSLSLDEVLAKGVSRYQDDLTKTEGNGTTFGGFLVLIGGVILVVGVYKIVSSSKEAKKYEEEAKDLRAQLILSKPLETFGNQEINDLKDKYK